MDGRGGLCDGAASCEHGRRGLEPLGPTSYQLPDVGMAEARVQEASRFAASTQGGC